MKWSVVLVCLGVRAAAAQPPDAEPEEQEIAPDEPVTAPKPRPLPVPDTTPVQVNTMDEVTVPRTNVRFGINFFGDMSFLAVAPTEPNAQFSLGTLGIRLLGDLSPSVDALAELAFETTAAGPIADVEQTAIRWRAGPGTLEVGRFHTDLGYWNTAYHHGLWLQTPVERPHVVRFEDDGGLAPVHWVGLQYALVLRGPGGSIAVVTGVGNGRGRIVDDVRVLDDTNAAKALLLKVRYKTEHVEVGAGAVYDRIAPEGVAIRPTLPDRSIGEYIANAYLVARPRGLLLIGEGYAFRHQAGAQTWTTLAGYGLVGYAVNDWLNPYAAVDVIEASDTPDPFFVPDPMVPVAIDVQEVMAGVRFDVSTWSAVKLELRFTRRPGADDEYAGVANWSFGL